MNEYEEIFEFLGGLQGEGILNEPVELIPFENSLKEHGKHGAHCCIWAPTKTQLVGLETDVKLQLAKRALILMHLRFDGHLGFAGGTVDDEIFDVGVEEGRSMVAAALRRELEEEINFDSAKYSVSSKNYLFTSRNVLLRNGKPAVYFLHFFDCKITEDDIISIERNAIDTYEHGREVFGNVQVPLFTMKDGYRGFPSFLRNQFIGTALKQLLCFLIHFGIMSRDEVKIAFSTSRPAISKSTNGNSNGTNGTNGNYSHA